MKDIYRTWACLAAVACLAPVPQMAAAQSGSVHLGNHYMGDVPEVDVSVPKSPAFTILGLSPQNASNPSTATELGASLLNAIDRNGDLQTGVALDTNPYLVFYGDAVSLGDYQGSYMTRLLTNTQVSLATAKSTEGSNKSTQIALGLHVTPWIAEEHDPRRNGDYLGCLAEAFAELPPPHVTGDVLNPLGDGPAFRRRDADEKLLLQALKKKRCKENFAPAFNNPSAWTLGVTPAAISKSGSLDDLDWAGIAFWSTLGIRLHTQPLGFDSQFVLHGRFRLDEVVADTTRSGAFIEQDTGVAAARFRAGSPLWNVSAEAAYFHSEREDGRDDSYPQFTGGAEFRLTEGFWLETEVGRTTGKLGKDDTFGNVSLKWNLGAQ